MENLKKYLTNKNIFITQIVSSVITILTALLIFGTVGGIKDSVSDFNFDALTNNIGTINFICTLFYLLFIVLVILVAVSVYKIVVLHEKSNEIIGLAALDSISLIIALFCLPTITEISKIASSFSQGAESMLNSLFGMTSNSVSSLMNVVNLKWPAIIFVILQVVAALIAYLIYQNKSIDTLNGVVGNNVDLKKYKDKITEYTKNEKNRKNLIIGGSAFLGAVVVLGGTAVYLSNKKTPVDLMTSCQVTFEGYDGYGDARFTCSASSGNEQDDENVSEFLNSVTYSISNDRDLSNGDTVTVKAEYSPEFASEQKIEVTENEKTFTVEGLNKVYSSWDMISKEDQKTMLDVMEPQLYESLESDDDSVKTIIHSVEKIVDLYRFDEYDKAGELCTIFKVDYTKESKILDMDYEYYVKVTTSAISPGEDGKGVADGWDNLKINRLYGVENDTQVRERYIGGYENYEEIK